MPNPLEQLKGELKQAVYDDGYAKSPRKAIFEEVAILDGRGNDMDMGEEMDAKEEMPMATPFYGGFTVATRPIYGEVSENTVEIAQDQAAF